MAPDLVIFDLDGTLIDSRLEITYAVNHVREKYGLSKESIDKIEPLIGLSPERFFDSVTIPVPLDEAVREFRLYLRNHLGSYSRPAEGSHQLVSFLSTRQIKCAIATTKPTDLATKAAIACDIRVDFIQGTDGFEPKPDPEVVLRCLAKFSQDGSKALMVGDRSADIVAGRRAGCMTAGIRSDTTSNLNFESTRPDFVFDSLSDLHFWMQELI